MRRYGLRDDHRGHQPRGEGSGGAAAQGKAEVMNDVIQAVRPTRDRRQGATGEPFGEDPARAEDLRDADGALDLLGPYLATATASEIGHVEADPDLDGLRDDARFQALMLRARARTGATSQL